MDFNDDAHFFCYKLTINFLEKLIPDYQICYKFSFRLLNLIMVIFCFAKSLKVPENSSAMQSFLFINYTEQDMLIQYLM